MYSIPRELLPLFIADSGTIAAKEISHKATFVAITRCSIRNIAPVVAS